MGVCTRECKGMTAGVLMATPVTIPCTKSLGGGSGENKRRPPAGRRDAGLEPRSPPCTSRGREGWFFLKIPRGDIDGVGEVK